MLLLYSLHVCLICASDLYPQIKEENNAAEGGTEKKPKGQRDDIDTVDDQETYFEAVENAEPKEEEEVEYDEDGYPIPKIEVIEKIGRADKFVIMRFLMLYPVSLFL